MMKPALTCIYFICILYEIKGLELSLDLNVPVSVGHPSVCGVLTCEESFTDNTAHTSTGSVSPNRTISSMSIFRTTQSSPTGGSSDSDKKHLLTVLTLSYPKITGVSDGVKVDGVLEAGRATLRLEMVKDEDCSAVYSCEVRTSDDHGNELVQTNTLRQRPEQRDGQANGAVNTPGAMMQQLTLLQKQVTFIGASLDVKFANLETRLGDRVHDDIAALQNNLNMGFEQLKTDVNNISIETVSAVHGLQADTNMSMCNSLKPVEDDIQSTETCTKGMISPFRNFTFPYIVIEPNGTSEVDAPYLCDPLTDGGGWIVIQRRVSGDVDFYRTWAEYKDGFGSLKGDFWWGNENVYALTNSGKYELRVDLKFRGESRFAHYSSFSLDHEYTNYMLRLGDYDGTAGDSLRKHDRMPFSTYDWDKGSGSDNYAEMYSGAWWYYSGHHSNLNGEWSTRGSKAARWFGFSRSSSVSYSEMKIRKM